MAQSPAPAGSKKPKSRLVRLFPLLIAILFLVLWPVAREHIRAMSLLARMAQQQNWLTRLNRHSYDIRTLTFNAGSSPVRASLYVPRGLEKPPAMVLVHGLHQLGMDEPRLVGFAKALAETGVEVLTPQVDAIADYRVEPQSIEVIGRSAEQLSQLTGAEVGVLGLSFAGGLSLMAAADPRFSDRISFVAAVGAQDDLLRVEHYLVEGRTQWPNGKTLTTPPHEYGWLILIYSHPEDFFDDGDAEAARTSLRLLLHEDVASAKAQALKLSPSGQQMMSAIFQHQREGFRDRLLADLYKHSSEALAVSPHNHLQTLKATVLLVHGEGDDVIPPSETQWLAQEVPAGRLQKSLISRAISHVSLEHLPSSQDQLAIVHWIALMLTDADREYAFKK